MAKSKIRDDEREWLAELQAVLNKCPSMRLGFYSTGDRCLTVFDTTNANIEKHYGGTFNTLPYSLAVQKAEAEIGTLNFPSEVVSTIA